MSKSFELLCPRTKWKKEHRNLCIGDIVLIKTEQKIGKGHYRLAKITDTIPDHHGRVRTVKVQVRSLRRARGEKAGELKAGTEVREIAIQRLVFILPAEEAWKGGVPDDSHSES